MKAFLLGLVFLTGCASTGLHDRLDTLKEFSSTDARKALTIMTLGGDKPGVQCFTYLVAKIDALQVPQIALPDDGPPGLLEVFARVRVAIHGQNTGQDFLTDLDLHCAALRTSIEIDVAKGAVMGAKIAGSGGATAPSAIAKVMPMLLRLLRPAG